MIEQDPVNRDRNRNRNVQRLGEGLFQIVGPPLEEGRIFAEGEPSSATQAAAAKNTEQYWNMLLELRDELMQEADNGDLEAQAALPEIRRELRDIYMNNDPPQQ